MHDFNYHRPTSLADAAKALGAGADAKLVAGGMTLIPTLKQRPGAAVRPRRSRRASPSSTASRWTATASSSAP